MDGLMMTTPLSMTTMFDRVEQLFPKKQIVTATSGSGTRGTFDVRVPFKAPSGSAIELYAYEASAEDGA